MLLLIRQLIYRICKARKLTWNSWLEKGSMTWKSIYGFKGFKGLNKRKLTQQVEVWQAVHELNRIQLNQLCHIGTRIRLELPRGATVGKTRCRLLPVAPTSASIRR